MPGRRVELGFEGGAVLRVTVEDKQVQELVGGLDGGGGWRSFEAEEGTYWLNLGELLFLRLVPGDVPSRVGFGGA
jgi:hypothetical protein